jgi:hypothetical protein
MHLTVSWITDYRMKTYQRQTLFIFRWRDMHRIMEASSAFVRILRGSMVKNYLSFAGYFTRLPVYRVELMKWSWLSSLVEILKNTMNRSRMASVFDKATT